MAGSGDEPAHPGGAARFRLGLALVGWVPVGPWPAGVGGGQEQGGLRVPVRDPDQVREVTREGAVAAVAAAARAAHDLHEAGIAHRDIKPANILLTDDGAKLADLGLVQVLAPGQTITGLGAIGSVEYLDPAIMRGERASRATDIWALGVTLHRVLTGTGVYGDLPQRDPLLAVRRVLSSPPTLDPSLSDAEAELVRRCLDPDLTARYRTAAEVADALDALGRA